MGARFVYEELGLKKSAVIFDVSSDFDKNIAIDFQSKFESLGGKVVLFEGFQPEAINIEQFLKKTINLESEIIFLTPRSFRHDLAKGIIDKSRELNYTGYFLGHGIWAYSNGVTVEGLTREGSFYLLDFSRENPRPEVQNFINNYRRRYRVNPCLRAAEGYDAANILFEAIKNAGTIDGSGIKEALMNTRIHGVAGLIGFDNNRNSRRAVDFIQVKKGEAIYRSTVFP